MMNYYDFFARKASTVARDLLGRTLQRSLNGRILQALILETGAYEGGAITPTRKGMNYAPGKLFLMPHRGIYLFNIATDQEFYPSCVEVRAVELNNKIIKGSGSVTKALKISSSLDGALIGKEIQVHKVLSRKYVRVSKGQAKNCLGTYRAS